MRPYVFLFSKPFHVITIFNIVESLGLSGPIVLVGIRQFSHADMFSRQIEMELGWRVELVDSRFSALCRVFRQRPAAIWVDSDYGKDKIINFIYSQLAETCLYEEGIFSYQDSLESYYLQRERWKTRIYRLLGLNMRHGASGSISKFYLYHPDWVQCPAGIRAQLVTIKNPFFFGADRLASMFWAGFGVSEKTMELLDSRMAGLNVCVVATDKSGSYKSFVGALKASFDVVVLKKHPGLANVDELESDSLVVEPSAMPVEILVISLMKRHTVTLASFNSSAAYYLRDGLPQEKSINYINL